MSRPSRRVDVAALVLGAGIAMAWQPAHPAGMLVFDPANMSHNLMTDIQTLRSNLNEAAQIANQVTQLGNEARNLASLPYSILQSYTSQYGRLATSVQNITGLVRDIQALEANFQALFPDFSQRTRFTGPDMVAGLAAWRTHLNSSITDSLRNGAHALETLPATQRDVGQLVTESQGSVGTLQALQAGNQISAEVAGQLLQLNAQLALYQNAHLEYLASVQGEEAMSRRRKADLTSDWTRKSTATPVARPGR